MDPGIELGGDGMEWHYSNGGQRFGPVDAEIIASLIRSGDLGPADLVWRPPWGEWRRLGQVEDFAGLFPAERRKTPPPLPGDPVGIGTPARASKGRAFGGIDFVWCPSGTFLMGSPADEPRRFDEEIQRSVTLTRGFWIGRYPVTRAQWLRVMARNPGEVRGTDLEVPVEKVSWHEVNRFCARMGEGEEIEIRLPTEAEWEYACRAGSPGPWGFHPGRASALGEHAWFSENSHRRTHPVGQKKPNAWGIHDMHGNVWEWCQDRHAAYPAGPSVDPAGPQNETADSSRRVCRGGSWNSPAERCRAAYRHRIDPEKRLHRLGFRVVASDIP